MIRKINYNVAGDQGHVKLEVGCGPIGNRQSGFIGLDVIDYGQEIVWDIEHGIPLPDNSCSEIFTQHTLEHIVDLSGVMKEFWRILKNGGKLTAIVPHKNSSKALAPSHVRLMDEGTFESFGYENYTQGQSGAWKIEDIAVNDRPDIIVVMSPIK